MWVRGIFQVGQRLSGWLIVGLVSLSVPSVFAGPVQVTGGEQMLYSGTIVNEQGEPLEGVQVGVYYRIQGVMSMLGGEVTTDSQGRWETHLPVDVSNVGVRLCHPDYISFHFEESGQSTPLPDELKAGTNVMMMKRGIRIHGTVLDEKGRPVENALVAAGELYSHSPQKGIVEDCTTNRTAKDGSFSIGGLPQRKLDIAVSGAGYAPKIVPVDVKPSMKAVSLILGKGRTYTGRVVDKDGRAIEGVRVDCSFWILGSSRRFLDLSAVTDHQGYFAVKDIPVVGNVSFIFVKKGSGLKTTLKQMPQDLSVPDTVVMYPRPVIAGRVVDDETGEPVQSFTLIDGLKNSSVKKIWWSRYYKQQVQSADGTFRHTWSGFVITEPFNGRVYVKIEAKGYLPAASGGVMLQEPHEPFEIRLEPAEPISGVVVDGAGGPVQKGQVGWVGPEHIAYITNGRFENAGIVGQVEQIVDTDSQGRFELGPTKDEGLIVVVGEKGYALVERKDLKLSGKIELTRWAKIVGTIALAERPRDVDISVEPVVSAEQQHRQKVMWSFMFNRISVSDDTFVVDHLPSVWLRIGRIERYFQTDTQYLKPQPGGTYTITIGGKGAKVLGRIVCPAGDWKMSNPRQVNAAAFRIEPPPDIPDQIKQMPRSDFAWLWRDGTNVYERSKTFDKRFIPRINDDGHFVFDALQPGTYEFVVNVHRPLGEKISCGRGVLSAVGFTKFAVGQDGNNEPVKIADVEVKLLSYPQVGQ